MSSNTTTKTKAATAVIFKKPEINKEAIIQKKQTTDVIETKEENGITFIKDTVTNEWIPQFDESIFETTGSTAVPEGLQANTKKRKREHNTRPASIFVSNLPKDATLQEIDEFFSKTGIILQDPYSGEKKIKMYEDEEGKFKGEALVTYFRPESVQNAFILLDDTPFRFDSPSNISLSQAEFKGKKKKPKKKKTNVKRKKLVDQRKVLSWDEEDRTHIVLKGLYKPEDAWTDQDFFKDLKQEIREELEKLGKIAYLQVFEFNPEGVVCAKFVEPQAAAACIAKMNGRFFAGTKISADYYDGVTDFKVKESEEMRKGREAAWEKWLEEGSSSDEDEDDDDSDKEEDKKKR